MFKYTIMKNLLIHLFFFNIIVSSFAQTISTPFFASVSNHPITIEKIYSTPKNTIVNLTIENQIINGNFCVDKNTYIIDILSGKKYKLIKVLNIPNCPSAYNFKFIGETLNFQLVFQKIDSKTKYINLIENCNQHCFFLKGIILDQNQNKELSNAYNLYAKGNFEVAIKSFIKIINQHSNYPFGFIHYSLIKIYAEKYDFESAKIWLNTLRNSNFHDKNDLLDKLKKENFYHKLK